MFHNKVAPLQFKRHPFSIVKKKKKNASYNTDIRLLNISRRIVPILEKTDKRASFSKQALSFLVPYLSASYILKKAIAYNSIMLGN